MQLKFRVWNGVEFDREPRLMVAFGNLPGGVCSVMAFAPRVIQPWTGLTDVKGREIYEGDIMVWYKVPALIDVEWKEWEKKGKPLQRHVFEIRSSRFFDGWGGYDPKAGEVVGNIFETPQLLS